MVSPLSSETSSMDAKSPVSTSAASAKLTSRVKTSARTQMSAMTMTRPMAIYLPSIRLDFTQMHLSFQAGYGRGILGTLSSFAIQSRTWMVSYSFSPVLTITWVMPALMMRRLHIEQGMVSRSSSPVLASRPTR